MQSNFLFIGLEDYCRRLGEEEELSSLSSGEKKEMRNTLKVIIKFVDRLCKMQFIRRCGGVGTGIMLKCVCLCVCVLKNV